MEMTEYYHDRNKFDRLPYHERVETLNRFITQDRAHWQDIHDNGCNDPYWPDGVNMNLVRNHVINWIRTLYEISTENRQISMFDLLGSQGGLLQGDFMTDSRIPEEVSDQYMARERVCHYFDVR